ALVSGQEAANRIMNAVLAPRPHPILVGGGPGDPELITVRGRRLLAHADVVVADRLAPLVGGGPGDPELITVRGRRLLAHADVVVADRLAPPELLAELPPHVEVIDAAKIPYGRAMAQDAINDVMIERARSGSFVVRLKGGDPFVFARGYEEVLACAEAGIPVTVVPGVTSAIGVPALAGVPVTHRAINHEFVVVSGHVAPGHPESLVNWDALAAMTGTIVLLMAVERIELFADVLLKGGRRADTPVLVVQHGTTAAQRTLWATLADTPEKIRAEGIRPPAIIVIGAVVGLSGFRRLNGS
ncbi:uroporphyrinogen-III C-methyltransferase, partial [Mycobacterium palustre]|uniref:uroporphyrinogen-III C-methyltransferase n=1 Tax=Mycobacterium palustre TaxID=153971 RepID=UPI0021F33F10